MAQGGERYITPVEAIMYLRLLSSMEPRIHLNCIASGRGENRLAVFLLHAVFITLALSSAIQTTLELWGSTNYPTH